MDAELIPCVTEYSAYLSGPMTVHGAKDFNYPAFHAAQERWEAKGFRVLNPARNFEGRTDLPRRAYMRRDFELVLEATHIVLLEGWQHSSGGETELAMAMELELEVLYDHGE